LTLVTLMASVDRMRKVVDEWIGNFLFVFSNCGTRQNEEYIDSHQTDRQTDERYTNLMNQTQWVAEIFSPT
jgi:hypothetical protein